MFSHPSCLAVVQRFLWQSLTFVSWYSQNLMVKNISGREKSLLLFFHLVFFLPRVHPARCLMAKRKIGKKLEGTAQQEGLDAAVVLSSSSLPLKMSSFVGADRETCSDGHHYSRTVRCCEGSSLLRMILRILLSCVFLDFMCNRRGEESSGRHGGREVLISGWVEGSRVSLYLHRCGRETNTVKPVRFNFNTDDYVSLVPTLWVSYVKVLVRSLLRSVLRVLGHSAGTLLRSLQHY